MESEERPKGPFCPGCGKQVLPTTEICPNCGTRTKRQRYSGARPLPDAPFPVTPDGRAVTGEKEIVVSIILSLIIPGAGTIYAGSVKRGLIILVLSIAVPILVFTLIVSTGAQFGELNVVLFFAFIVFEIGLYIYSIVDAYRATDDNNRIWHQYLDQER